MDLPYPLSPRMVQVTPSNINLSMQAKNDEEKNRRITR